jgi:exodeoxyribonuclease VII large subunit
VAGAKTPVVSAIGHENDSPLLDLVADLRASTPTDAAKRVVPDIIEERRNLANALERIFSRVSNLVISQQQLIQAITSRPVLASPFGFVDSQSDNLEIAKRRLVEILDFRLGRAEAELSRDKASLRSLSPVATLERGYAVITGADGKPRSKFSQGDELRILTAKQEISAVAKEVKEK